MALCLPVWQSPIQLVGPPHCKVNRLCLTRQMQHSTHLLRWISATIAQETPEINNQLLPQTPMNIIIIV